MFLQDPNTIKPFDVVVFEAHGDVPKMEQAMWPRHCVQVVPYNVSSNTFVFDKSIVSGVLGC